MAKRKRIRDSGTLSPGGRETSSPFATTEPRTSFHPATLLGLAAALLAAAMVYAGYWPCDSIAVQLGAARYLVGLLVVTAAIAFMVLPGGSGESTLSSARNSPDRWWQRVTSDRAVDGWAWALAGWMALSTWINSDEANLRFAVNELGWWVAAAALFSAARRIFAGGPAARSGLYLLAGIAAGVAVYGWHQWLVSFPALIARYESDPEAVLAEMGIFAEPGSSRRIVFENRLYDGGPTGTFALANSMAAMLVGGTIATGLLIVDRWRTLTTSGRLLSVIVALPLVGMLIASRSRSAVASVVLVIGLMVLWRCFSGASETADSWEGFDSSTTRRRLAARRRRALVWSLAAAGAATAAAVLAAIFHQTEWVGQAPASLATRFRYWIASAKMVAQSPWFGVGPGQFKARHEAFRDPVSTEQIADPHNAFWQVLTTGGYPAGLILVGLLAAIGFRLTNTRNTVRRSSAGERGIAEDLLAETASQPSVAPRQLYLGAAIAVALIWLGGAVIGHFPSFDAGLLGTFAGALTVLIAIRFWQPVATSGGDGATFWPLRRIAGWAALGIAIDLMAAGGLTVPGVAVPLWVLLGILVPLPSTRSGSQVERVAGVSGSLARFRGCVSVVAAILLGGWYISSVLPVERSAAALGRFSDAWARGRIGEAQSAIAEAVTADRWDVEPARMMADMYLQMTLNQPDPAARESLRLNWAAAEAEVLARGGRDPAIIRVLADGRLWHYQRFGDRESLVRAAEWSETAVELSPAHETYAAQLAEVYRELGDPRAAEMADRAERLSLAGGYYERRLEFISLVAAEPVGAAAATGPTRRVAAEALSSMLLTEN